MKTLTYCIDIDNTICTTKNLNYADSAPIRSRIEKINELYDQGHTIKYFTARGMGRSNDNVNNAYASQFCLTQKQLDDWGCKYHNLILGKPSADYYLDDKALKLEDVFNENS